jgi:D-psicose/D-tagatose/L-ribulose 3-epimerase
MKFGVNTFLFTAPFTNEKFHYFKIIREMGFDGVEIVFQQKEFMDLKEARKLLREIDLSCCSLCGAFGPGKDLRGNDQERATAREFIKDGIRACADLDCDVFAGPIYSTVGRASFESKEARAKQWETVVSELQELCTYAKEYGVYLCVEVMNRFATDFLNTCSDAVRLLKDVGSSYLTIHLDTFHMNIEENNLSMAILDAGDSLYNFHVAENHRGMPGTGTIDWIGIRDALNRINYNRYIVIESFLPNVLVNGSVASIWRPLAKSSEEFAEKSLKFLEALFQ